MVIDEFRCHYHADGSGYNDREVQEKIKAVNDVNQPFGKNANWYPAEAVLDDSGVGWKVIAKSRR